MKHAISAIFAAAPVGTVTFADKVMHTFKGFGEYRDSAAFFSYVAAGVTSLGVLYYTRRKTMNEERNK